MVTAIPRHDRCVMALIDVFCNHLPEGWQYCAGASVALSDSRPRPDGLLLRGGGEALRPGHPVEAVGLIVEVIHLDPVRDRSDKARIYARAGIVRYWVVDPIAGRVEDYEHPSGPTASPHYTTVTAYRRGQSVPFVLDGVAVALIAVDDVLP